MEIQITAFKFEMVKARRLASLFPSRWTPRRWRFIRQKPLSVRKLTSMWPRAVEELKVLKYSMKDFLEEWKKQIPVVEAEELAKADASSNNPDSRVDADRVIEILNE